MAQPEVMSAADEAAEEAAFEAGFDGATVEPEPSVQDSTVEESQDSTTDDDPPAEEPATPAETPPASLTMAEVQALLSQQKQEFDANLTKTQDRLFGKLGEFNQKLEAIKSHATGLSPQARERLEEQFPELAQMMFDGAATPTTPEAAPAPAAQPEPAISTPSVDKEQLKEELRRELAYERVLEKHEDYHAIIAAPTFETWRGEVLDPELAAEFNSSWDAKLINKRLTEYKGWLAAQAAMQKRTDALDAAVVPRGVPRSAGGDQEDDDEEAAMLKAYGRK